MARNKLDAKLITNFALVIALGAILINLVTADSIISGNAVTIIRADSTPHPQLKIISFFSRPATPQTGSTVTFYLTVKNFGDNSQATTVDFLVNNKLIKTMPLRALERRSSELIKVTWTAAGKGSYTATASVIPVKNEVTTSDNTDKITFRVTN